MSKERGPIDRQRLDELLRIAPFHQWLGLTVKSCSDEQIELEMPWREEIVSNPMIGSAHGGVLASLIDLTGLYTLLSQGVTAKATADLRVDYHRPATSGPLIVTGPGGQGRKANLGCRKPDSRTGRQNNRQRQGCLHMLARATLTAFCLALAACSGGVAENEAEQEIQSGPRKVRTMVVEPELLAEPVKAFGTIAAKQSSSIGALTEGPVERIFVKVGDRVSRGQPLFRIRQADYHRRVAEAQAAVDLANAQAIEAERRYERVIALAPRGFVSKAQVDAVETELAVARAQKTQALAALGTAQQALSDTITRAPYDGVVTARLVDEGVYLNNRFSMGGQSAALQLQELGTVAVV